MFDISLVIQTSGLATPDDLQRIVQQHSRLSDYIYDAHPDVRIIAPLEDKVSISIDQVHSIHANLSLSPVRGVQKVIVIHPASALTLPAQQALLKLVEEPPSKVLFLLVTHTPYLLLPTIISRCRVIRQTTNNEKQTTTFVPPKNHAEAIKTADEYGAKKESALAFINQVIAHEQDAHVQKEAIKALGLLHKNINAKLVLDEFLFSLLN